MISARHLSVKSHWFSSAARLREREIPRSASLSFSPPSFCLSYSFALPLSIQLISPVQITAIIDLKALVSVRVAGNAFLLHFIVLRITKVSECIFTHLTEYHENGGTLSIVYGKDVVRVTGSSLTYEPSSQPNCHFVLHDVQNKNPQNARAHLPEHQHEAE